MLFYIVKSVPTQFNLPIFNQDFVSCADHNDISGAPSQTNSEHSDSNDENEEEKRFEIQPTIPIQNFSSDESGDENENFHPVTDWSEIVQELPMNHTDPKQSFHVC